jgi:hypothetical protein
MTGTRLMVSLVDSTEQEAYIRRTKHKTTIFVLTGTWTVEDVCGLTVVRGNESQDAIKQHLFIGRQLLRTFGRPKKARPGGLQFGAQVLGLLPERRSFLAELVLVICSDLRDL